MEIKIGKRYFGFFFSNSGLQYNSLDWLRNFERQYFCTSHQYYCIFYSSNNALDEVEVYGEVIVMKISTWNIERLKKKKHLPEILSEIEKINADILVLTETDSHISPTHYPFKVETKPLILIDKKANSTENRVSIFSKFPIMETFETYDEFTSCLAEIETPFGNLFVYGTIVGVLGNRNEQFIPDLKNQMNDLQKLSEKNICFIGDLNCTFLDNYYFTNEGRTLFDKNFKALNLKNITAEIPENIDNIVISGKFVERFKIELSEFNLDKKLSDHKGIIAEFIPI